MHNLKILNKSEFNDLISYERERSERTNSPFSLIYVDLSKINGRTNGKSFEKIIKTIAISIRNIDRTGWLKNNTIGIFLPDTQITGAKTAAIKFKNKLIKSLGEDFFLLNFVVSTYPSPFDSKENKLRSKDTTSSVSSQPTIFKMEYLSNPQMSDSISVDSSCILDLSVLGLRDDWQFVIKRLMDIVGALVGIIIFSPLRLIIAAVVKLTSKGPVFFQQERTGYHGKKFLFLKFRSMFTNNDESLHREYVEKLIQGNHDEINMGSKDCPYYKIKNDPRVTPLGRILRKSSMDELPQFFNVLKGQMSLVGPRPPIPYELENYQSWHLKRILDVKPGITGLWQVKGRSLSTFNEMVRLDLQYSKKWNLWLDIKILLSTIKVVLMGNGAN
jgi:lipopolysaccharide/colanic/teichoic acid biosynthesis glycosyltransferase